MTTGDLWTTEPQQPVHGDTELCGYYCIVYYVIYHTPSLGRYRDVLIWIKIYVEVLAISRLLTSYPHHSPLCCSNDECVRHLLKVLNLKFEACNEPFNNIAIAR